MSKQTKKAQPNQLFVKIGSGKTVLCQIPSHEKTTVRDLKIQLQPKCQVEVSDQRLTYDGKLLWDDDWLQVEPNATLHLSRKSRGGNIGNAITKGLMSGVNAIIKPLKGGIDKLVNFVTDIFNKVTDIFKKINCVIRRLGTLRFCLLFYVIFLVYKTIIYIFYIVLFIIGIMVFTPWLANSFLKGEKKLKNFILNILKKLEGVKDLIYAIECCFKCDCENGAERWINNLFSKAG